MSTSEQIAAADKVRECCNALSLVVKQASELGLEVSIEILPYYVSISGRRVYVPIVESSVKKVEVL